MFGKVSLEPARERLTLQQTEPEDLGKLADHLFVGQPVVLFDPEEVLDREVEHEEAGRHHGADHRVHFAQDPRLPLVLEALGEDRLVAILHAAIHARDVGALELDHVDVDQANVAREALDRLARRMAEALEVLGKVDFHESLDQRLIGREVPLLEGLHESLEQRFLRLEVIVDVAERDLGAVGDLAQPRAVKALGREQLLGRGQDPIAVGVLALDLARGALGAGGLGGRVAGVARVRRRVAFGRVLLGGGRTFVHAWKDTGPRTWGQELLLLFSHGAHVARRRRFVRVVGVLDNP